MSASLEHDVFKSIGPKNLTWFWLKTQILSNVVPKIHHVFWPEAGKTSSNQARKSTGWWACRACANLGCATTADTSHTGCRPDHLQCTHNWLLVVCEGKPSSHPARSHMSQSQRADKARRPQCHKEPRQPWRKRFWTSSHRIWQRVIGLRSHNF